MIRSWVFVSVVRETKFCLFFITLLCLSASGNMNSLLPVSAVAAVSVQLNVLPADVLGIIGAFLPKGDRHTLETCKHIHSRRL